jgi:3-dehydroquinate synthase
MSSPFHKFHQGPVVTMRWTSLLNLKTRVDVGYDARKNAGDIISQATSGKKVLIVHQAAMKNNWLDDLYQILDNQKLAISTLELADGEEGKSFESLSQIWQTLQEKMFDRTDTVIALGGGATCDVTSFAASTYLRGINLVLMPTTLLAQVDAAIGGKTAINLTAGKNLAGTFYFPQAVLIDPAYLSTLPDREFTSALAEIIKYGLIEQTIAENTDYRPGPKPFLTILEENLPQATVDDSSKTSHPVLPGIITACIKMKLSLVAKDPHESKLRRCLNLGHTLAHALEKVSQYKLSHGEAVAIGTCFALKVAISKHFVVEESVARIAQLTEEVGLPTDIPNTLNKEELLKAIKQDKKRQGETIKFVMPKSPLGVVDFNYDIKIDELAQFI